MQDIIVKNNIAIPVRVFSVAAHDQKTDEAVALTVPVTKEQLRAAGLIGESSKELITRICECWGFTFIEIGTAEKLTVNLDLAEAYAEDTCGGAAD